MKRIVNRKGLTVLGVVALIIVLITAVTMSVSNGREGFFGRTVAAVTKPARSFFSQIADSLERLYGYMYKYDQLAEENAQLRLEIAQMEPTATPITTTRPPRSSPGAAAVSPPVLPSTRAPMTG